MFSVICGEMRNASVLFGGIKIILGKEDDRRLVAIFSSCFAFKMPFRNTEELAHVCIVQRSESH